MLSCRDVSHLSSDYINRDLPLRRRLAVRFHLLMCAGCTRYVAQMRSTIALLRRVGSRPAPASAEKARELFRSNHP